MKIEVNERISFNAVQTFGKVTFVDKEETPEFSSDNKVIEGKFSRKRVTFYSELAGDNVTVNLPKEFEIPKVEFLDVIRLTGATTFMPWQMKQEGQTRSSKGITIYADGLQVIKENQIPKPEGK